MRKLLLGSFVVLAVAFTAKAQNSDFKPSGNFWGYGFADYYYMSHADSLGRGAGNVQYKPLSTNSTLNVSVPTGVTSVTTLTGGPPPTGATTLTTLTNTKSNLLGSGTANKQGANGFQLRRFYLGYDYNFAPKFTAYAVVADEQNLDAGGNNSMYLKYAYVKWADIFPHSNLLIGQQPTPSFSTTPFGTEPLWGYRSIERTIMDIHNNDASSDLGISLQGDIWRGASGDTLKPNLLGYMLQIGNGNSAKPENDGYKTVRGTLYTSLLQQKLTIGVYGDFHTIALGSVDQSLTTYKAYANYKTSIFKIGAEVFTQSIKNGAQLASANGVPFATATYENVNIMGWSVFLSGKIFNNLNYFARIDMYNPDTKYSNSNVYSSVPTVIQPQYTTDLKVFSLAGDAISQSAVFSTQTFYTLGFDYTPVKRLHIMPNIWVDQFNSQANVSSAAKLAKSDYDFVPRLTVYWVFNGSKSINNNGMDN